MAATPGASMDTETNDPVLNNTAEMEEEEQQQDDYSFDSTAAMPIRSKIQRPKNISVPELLALRQVYGSSPLALPPFSRPRRILPDVLSSKIAWNPNRLQNMILICGPGTPAALVDLTKNRPAAAMSNTACPPANDEDSSSGDIGNDDDDDDDSSDESSDDTPVQSHDPSVAAHHHRTESLGSSSTTASRTKRTLSDRLKVPEEGEEEVQDKHDMNLDTATSSSDDDDGDKADTKPTPNKEVDSEPETKPAPDKREQWTKKKRIIDDNDDDDDESMEGYSDVEEELVAKESNDDKCTKEESSVDEKDSVPEDDNGMESSSSESSGDNEEEKEEEAGPRRQRQIETQEEDNDSDVDEEMRDFREMAAEWFAMEQAEIDDEGDIGDSDDDDDDDDEDDSDAEARAAARIIIRRRILRRSASPAARNRNSRETMKPALRHGGCINTAAWLDAGWRLSTVSQNNFDASFNANASVEEDAYNLHAMLSDECPTQLITSGDDRIVKFWDVRHAMGSANPLPWGRNTHCPFADAPAKPGYRAQWDDYYRKQQPVEPWQIAGNVMPLASLNTGHRGNVFHVTPLWKQPGKVVTCGADGYLRMGDVEANSNGDASSASIIVSPEYFDDGSSRMMSGLFSLRPGMCFSHHFLNSNVGLLCSERGLRKFDIRLPPRQQERTALLGGGLSCKACAIWSVSSASSIEEVDSTYVFVGGEGSDVALCDLRMTGGDSSSDRAKIIHQYRPKCFSDTNDSVNVSGLDLSRDKRELLVSYESDQIYTFPIFPNAKSAAGPSLEEIGGLGAGSSELDEDDHHATNGNVAMLNGNERRRSGEDIYFNELASYGGHLNRFTFLKNAKYAGPNDEYICTGSDSGHAWIYERATGAVVSLLNADHSTCNGVVPHPTMPFFITYGIDSTAKLWRGTQPVDPQADDSPSGRAKCFSESPYEMSPLTREWESIQQEIASLEEDIKEYEVAKEANDDDDDSDSDELQTLNSPSSLGLLPDQVLSRKELISSGGFGRRCFYTSRGTSGTRIGNDLESLPNTLRRNQYECIRAIVNSSYGRRNDFPIESDVKELMRRISLLRLRHQADRQGLSGQWNASIPWIMGQPPSTDTDDNMSNDTHPEESLSIEAHPADLIPDNPSDWIPYDPEMSPTARPCGISFNVEEYGDFYRDRYLHSDKKKWEDGKADQTGLSWIWSQGNEDEETSQHDTSASENALKILYETAKVLKEGGNNALQAGEVETAARRYDKAIRYCSVAFIPEHSMATFSGENKHDVELLERRLSDLEITPGLISPMMLRWTPLLKVLISTRLNMSMLLLKRGKRQDDFTQPQRAAEQAQRALRELQPFCVEKGKIVVTLRRSDDEGCSRAPAGTGSRKGTVHTKVLRKGEPDDNYIEAKKLQTKAFFRLGSAEMAMGDYTEAIKSFEISIEYSMEMDPKAKLDPLVVRRLAEAKKEKKRRSKRHRKKFRKMFVASQDEDKEDEDDDEDDKETSSSPPVHTTVRDIPDDRRDRRQETRQRTAAAAIVTPPAPAPASRTAANEERATQSE